MCTNFVNKSKDSLESRFLPGLGSLLIHCKSRLWSNRNDIHTRNDLHVEILLEISKRIKMITELKNCLFRFLTSQSTFFHVGTGLLGLKQ